MKQKLAYIGVSFAFPFLALAASINDIGDLGDTILGIINGTLVPLVFAIAFIVFLWGAFQTFIQGANDDEVKTKGRNLMMWSIVGFAVMVSIWGLVNILTGTFSVGSTLNTPTSGVGAPFQVK